ncbi:MAG: hypothetical protein DRP45_07140 [Candidatus Zixiibacteriota bacterium]|nr:MAG: hypothetical protein DRP45_07140 [candidate division Zixibacteria bacterium]
MSIISFLLFCLVAGSAATQDTLQPPEQFGLEHLTDYLGLKPSDISYRSDYTEPDSLRLKVTAELMDRPLDMIGYAGGLRGAHVGGQPEILAGVLYRDLAGEHQSQRQSAYRPSGTEMQHNYNLYYTDITLNRLLSRVATYLDVIFPRSAEMSLAPLSEKQRRFLVEEFKEIVVMDEDDEFLSMEEIDSLEKVEEGYTEQFVGFATLIDKDPLVSAGIGCLRDLLLDIEALRSGMRNGNISAEKLLKGIEFLPKDVPTHNYLGRQPGWKIGGPGNDYYEGNYDFILDLGGNDVYDLSYDPSDPHGVIIIDLEGDDFYRAGSDFALGSGCLSVGLLLDFGGDDRYDAKSFGLGSGYFGFGLLYDSGGDDRYDGDTHVQGAGTFGIGLLIDEGGRDIYNAAVYSQGFGFVQGAGMIYEVDGSDTYYAGGKYKDILRYEDHYLSLSQGFGYGLRPWMSGGIGGIIDLSGNDNYYADIFAQASSYWWSIGLIYDSAGNDNYQCFQYAQGAATHMSLGILIDDYGNDVYFGKGLMQGCGHDYSCGLILDRHGNDVYTAYDLSQGAGSANGAGVQIDNEGDDRYYSKNRLNTQGYGNPRRDFGSIGLFIDLGGQDQYAGNGRDNYYWETDSKWGGGMDIELIVPDSIEAGGE